MTKRPHSLRGGGPGPNRQGREGWLAELRGDRRVRQLARPIVAAWRRLTGEAAGRPPQGDAERRTLIACSGGADSSALVIALAAGLGAKAGQVLVVGHIVHDLRSEEESLRDRDAAKGLADRLGLVFCDSRVFARSLKPGEAQRNLEARARQERYAALATLAIGHGCRFIATAHHAGDQLETMLMALVRGAGLRGLAGVAERRRLKVEPRDRRVGDIAVVRPMLDVSRRQCRELCETAGWQWQEDATNADESRLRAALRHQVVPVLERLRPGAAKRASSATKLIRAAAHAEAKRVRASLETARLGEGPHRFAWARAEMRTMPVADMAALIRGAALDLAENRGADRIGLRGPLQIARRIRSASTEPAEAVVGSARVTITAARVVVGPRNDEPATIREPRSRKPRGS